MTSRASGTQPLGKLMIQRHFGIDIAAKTFHAVHLYQKQAEHQSLTNDETGWEALLAWAKEIAPNAQLRFCIEHTGGYEVGLVRFLQERGIYVSLIDPSRIHHFALSLGKKRKSDPSDAHVLARYSRERRPEEWVARPEPYRLYLQLCRARDSYVEDRTSLLNRMKAPGVYSAIREHAELNLAVVEETIRRIEAQLAELEAELPELAQRIHKLDSIAGIGLVQARQILAELGPIESYQAPERVGLAAGLVPIILKSGTSLHKDRLIPYGNVRLRCAIFRAALTAERSDPAFKAYSARIASNGNKSRMTVLTACARKMSHVIWAVLTYNTDYDPRILMKDARLT